MESHNKYAKVDIYKSDKSKKSVIIAVVIILILAIIIGAAVAMITATKPSENSSSNNTITTTASTSTVATSETTTTSTTSTTSSIVATPTATTVTTGTADPSITTTPYVFKSTGFDMRLNIPAGWVASEDADKNQKDCQLSADYLRKSCTGSITDAKYVTIKSSDGTSVINIQGATSGIGTPPCNASSTTFFTTVKNMHIDFVTCIDKGVFSTGRTLVNYAGANSEWKSVLINWTSKDRPTVDVILDIIGSIY